MNLQIPTAGDMAKISKANARIIQSKKYDEMIAFINGKAANEIRLAAEKGKNSVEIEFSSCLYDKENFSRAEQLLTSRGYTVSKTHDGGGMYEIIIISWK